MEGIIYHTLIPFFHGDNSEFIIMYVRRPIMTGAISEMEEKYEK